MRTASRYFRKKDQFAVRSAPRYFYILLYLTLVGQNKV